MEEPRIPNNVDYLVGWTEGTMAGMQAVVELLSVHENDMGFCEISNHIPFQWLEENVMKPTDEQVQWLWEQCGLEVGIDNGQFYIKDRKELIYPTVDVDLNNLFKYVVPKLGRGSIELNTRAFRPPSWGETETHCILRLEKDPWVTEHKDKDPALALFWACYMALGGKVMGLTQLNFDGKNNGNDL